MVLAKKGLSEIRDFDSIDNALKKRKRYYNQHSSR